MICRYLLLKFVSVNRSVAMALSHPFLDEAVYELGPDIFRQFKKEDPSILYKVFNIYYGLQVKRLMLVFMGETCLAKYGIGCDCDRFDSITAAFHCYGHRAMDIIACDEENQAEIRILMKEHFEVIHLEADVDEFLTATKPFNCAGVKDQWLHDIIDTLENMLLQWMSPKHNML